MFYNADDCIQEKRFSLAIDSIKNTLANDVYENYYRKTAITIEEIIDELGYFISEIIIDHPEVVFSDSEDEEVNYLREQRVGFEDSITSRCAKYTVGDMVDAYIKKLAVDVIPLVDGFWIGNEEE